jgi:GT2 family glycosyltransferase
MAALPEAPQLIVVDNASSERRATESMKAAAAVVISLPQNAGCGGRNIGARVAKTPYVAFCDDDSYYAPGSLARAVEFLDSHPETALVVGRVLVGDTEELDPVSALIEASSCCRASSDARDRCADALGFLACAAIVRRDVFLAAGGFDGRYVIGAEEELLALDLARAGWRLCYVPDVVVHHYPAGEARPGRLHRQQRNGVVTALRRLPLRRAMSRARPSHLLRCGVSEGLALTLSSLAERRLVGGSAQNKESSIISQRA